MPIVVRATQKLSIELFVNENATITIRQDQDPDTEIPRQLVVVHYEDVDRLCAALQAIKTEAQEAWEDELASDEEESQP
jgi:hypothetical protein